MNDLRLYLISSQGFKWAVEKTYLKILTKELKISFVFMKLASTADYAYPYDTNCLYSKTKTNAHCAASNAILGLQFHHF
jgi:hypothetical protein